MSLYALLSVLSIIYICALNPLVPYVEAFLADPSRVSQFLPF